MSNHDHVWTLKKYLLYDFAHDQLIGSRLFASYEEAAAQTAGGRATVMIVPLVLERAEAAEGSEPCDCSRLAQF